MSGTVTIIYSDLEDGSKYAKKAHDKMEDYQTYLKKKIASELSKLPGEDSAGYISSAISLANEKVKKLTDSASGIQKTYKEVVDLRGWCKDADETVKNKVSSITDSNLGKQSTFQKVTTDIYNFIFVDVPSKLEEYSLFEGAIKNVRTMVGDVREIKDGIYEYFTTGAGEYVKNMIDSVLSVPESLLTVVGGLVGGAALCAIAPVLTPILGVAAGIYITTKAVDTYISYKSNKKALEEYHEAEEASDPTGIALAHYNMGTNGYSDWIEKNDFGNLDENFAFEIGGMIFDVARDASGTMLKTAEIIGGVVTKNAGDLDEGLKNFNKVLKNAKKVQSGIKRGWKSLTTQEKSARSCYSFSEWAGYNISPEKAYKLVKKLPGFKDFASEIGNPAIKMAKVFEDITKRYVA